MTLIEGTKTFPRSKSGGQKRCHTGTVSHYQQERRRKRRRRRRRRRGEEQGRTMAHVAHDI